MPRLFVAVDLPTAATASLVALQPAARPDVRLAAPDQFHLTLHFIGEADIERIADALSTVAFPAFSLTLQGVGQFPSAGGAVTLWVGVQESSELLELHTAVAAALADEGFRPEARRYTPHITLARCDPGVPAELVDAFVARHAKFALEMPIVGFSLYSSEFVGDAPVYRCLRSFVFHTSGARVD
jgi:RNA 2',3'-cyclic 3'-phosphodiesterase